MGGDCLNYGCVPSKALLAAGKAAHAMARARPSAWRRSRPQVDFAAAMDHVAATIAAIAPHDSEERFEGLGVRVIRDWARFVSPRGRGRRAPHPRPALRDRHRLAPLVPPIRGWTACPT
jgi:pyruvate/2-oxoglutarate dehydrogenase complex dihydrolipoamide dehydrogenase (E3) component